MEFVKLILIFSFLNLLNSSKLSSISYHDTIDISEGITSICEKFYIEKYEEISIYIYGYTTSQMFDIIDDFLRKVFLKTSMKVIYIPNINYPHTIHFAGSAIIIVKDSIGLETFKQKSIIYNRLPFKTKILIFTYDEIRTVPTPPRFYDDRTLLLHYFYYLRNEHSVLTFFKTSPFTHGNCNPSKNIPSTTLNIFNKTNRKWTTELRNYEAFDNFNGCALKVVDYVGPFMHFKTRSQEVMQCILDQRTPEDCYLLLTLINDEVVGLYPEIFKLLAVRANFTPIIRIAYRFDDFLPYINIPIIKLDTVSMNQEILFPIAYFLESSFMVAVTDGDKYTNYEKLLLPFDDVTWMLLAITFIGTFLVIIVIRFMSRSLKNLLIGHEIMTPALNVCQIFFGISQMKLPSASGPRVILTLFIFFCLIFRSCYQSMMFEFMTSDMQKPPPKTLEDIIFDKYQVLSCDQIHERELVHYTYNLRKRNNTRAFIYSLQDCNDLVNIYCKRLNERHKSAFFMEDFQYPIFNAACRKSGIRLKGFETYPSISPIVTAENSFLYNPLKKLMDKLVPAGIPQLLYKKSQNALFKKFEVNEDNEPKVLTIEDLSYGFVLWLGACGISFCGFMMEMISNKFGMIFKNIFGVIGILRLLREVNSH